MLRFIVIMALLIVPYKVAADGFLGNTHGGLSNYDLRGVGWATYYQIGVGKKIEGFDMGFQIQNEKITEFRDFIIEGIHFFPELFLAKSFGSDKYYFRTNISMGADISHEEYEKDLRRQYTIEESVVIANSESWTLSYTGAISISFGCFLKEMFKFGPNISFRKHEFGYSAETGIYTEIDL